MDDPLMRAGNPDPSNAPLFEKGKAPELRLSACRGCGKPILWAKLPDGKSVPLDPRPAVYLVIDDCDGYGAVRMGAADAPVGVRAANSRGVMVSHFATCSQANRFSASNKPSPKGGRE